MLPQPEVYAEALHDCNASATERHQKTNACAGTKKEKWVKDNQGQMVITAGQIVWTAECEKALSEPEGAKKALRLLKKKWVSYLNKLTAITRSKLTKIERNKVWRGASLGNVCCPHSLLAYRLTCYNRAAMAFFFHDHAVL
eukprot:GHUV01030509.1.p1 GENE.GHUV01030509.1~~GHUV01030509.1.p1  ORF type:complete len:141 (-),score=22.00 GHUV01030509.1:117-539(-)